MSHATFLLQLIHWRTRHKLTRRCQLHETQGIAVARACKSVPVVSEYNTQPKQSMHTLSSSGRFLVNQGWDLMPAMEILLAGLPTKILLIMSKHSREMCRFVGKLYFTPMILCSHAQRMSTFWHDTLVVYNESSWLCSQLCMSKVCSLW